jgi:hypothetical protein
MVLIERKIAMPFLIKKSSRKAAGLKRIIV